MVENYKPVLPYIHMQTFYIYFQASHTHNTVEPNHAEADAKFVDLFEILDTGDIGKEVGSWNW